MYKVGKKHQPAAANRVAERVGAGAGDPVVVGSNSVWFMEFFLFRSPKISKFFDRLDAGTKSTKFPVLLPALYRVSLFIKLISNINFVFLSEAYPTDLSFL